MIHNLHKRRGLTIIELLIVISIMLAILGIAAAVIPRSESRAVSTAADQIQGWLLIAKQRALRDNAPRGIRLIVEASRCTQMEYMEQPEPIFLGPATLQGVDANTSRLTLNVADPLTELTLRNETKFVEIPTEIPQFFIKDPGTISGSTYTCIVRPSASSLAPGISKPVLKVRFYRQDKPLQGESVLQLPKGTFIDPTKSLGVNSRKIMFSPHGEVINPNANKIILWLESENSDGTPSGTQKLITIYANSGQIAVHSVAPGGDPYLFAKDGKSPGL